MSLFNRCRWFYSWPISMPFMLKSLKPNLPALRFCEANSSSVKEPLILSSAVCNQIQKSQKKLYEKENIWTPYPHSHNYIPKPRNQSQGCNEKQMKGKVIRCLTKNTKQKQPNSTTKRPEKALLSTNPPIEIVSQSLYDRMVSTAYRGKWNSHPTAGLTRESHKQARLLPLHNEQCVN